MGIDWRTIGWLEYQMLLAGWNEIHRDQKGDSKDGPDLGRLRSFMKAHSVH